MAHERKIGQQTDLAGAVPRLPSASNRRGTVFGKTVFWCFSKDSLSKDGPAQVGPMNEFLDAIPDSTRD